MIPLDEHVFVLISRISFNSSYLTLTEVDVPIPTDWFGVTVKSINSLFVKLCAVDRDTCACILCNLPVNCSKLLFSEYSKLLDPIFVSPTKDNPLVLVVSPTCVTIPTKLSDLLIIKISWLFPDSGILNVVTPSSSDTVKAYPALGLVRVTLWFVTNGWFGNLILWSGVETTFLRFPRVEKAVDPKPTTVPTPIDSWGLKNTWSFNLDLISVTPNPVLSKLKILGIRFIPVPTVWTPEDSPLLTLSILFWSKVLRTNNFSVPIPMLLPTDILLGIFDK